MSPTQHAMDQAQGAAIRVQLDALVASLRAQAALADRHDDTLVLDMVDSLREAQKAAQRIEERAPAGSTFHTTGKGVRLAKVQTLIDKSR